MEQDIGEAIIEKLGELDREMDKMRKEREEKKAVKIPV